MNIKVVQHIAKFANLPRAVNRLNIARGAGVAPTVGRNVVPRAEGIFDSRLSTNPSSAFAYATSFRHAQFVGQKVDFRINGRSASAFRGYNLSNIALNRELAPALRNLSGAAGRNTIPGLDVVGAAIDGLDVVGAAIGAGIAIALFLKVSGRMRGPPSDRDALQNSMDANSLEAIIKKNLSTPYPPASLPGDFPRKRSGELQSSISVDMTNNWSGVNIKVHSATHGGFLEEGTGRMAPRPFLLASLDEWLSTTPNPPFVNSYRLYPGDGSAIDIL